MDTLSTIVAAVDFSKCSENALVQAARIAQWTRAGVRAVHVVEPLMYDISQPMVMFPVPTMADLVSDAEKRWQAFGLEAPGRSQISFASVIGNPTGEIVHFADQCSAGMICLGPHSVLDQHRGVGAVGAGVARHAHCDVLLVDPGHTGPFRSIVAAVDFSASSLTALEHAERFAALDGASLKVMHAYRDPWERGALAEEVGKHMPDFRERYREGVRSSVEKFADPIAHELRALKAEFHAMSHPSHAGAIGQFAKDAGADLIVLGSRGHSKLRDMFFGTTVEQVVRRTHCSVLVVKSR